MWAGEREDRGGGWLSRVPPAVLAGLSVCFLVLLVWSVIDFSSRRSDILERSLPARATIEQFTSRLRGGREAIVTYVVDGHRIRGETSIRGLATDVGDRVDVRYDPQNPKRVWDARSDEPPGGHPSIWMGIGFVGTTLSAAHAVLFARERRRSAGSG